ncbi:velvet factor-domain-containing protein [Xylogone sp. PMI_703]|nr:velvet factor-domain-containing protein [Xylogone sp. PMI_703]
MAAPAPHRADETMTRITKEGRKLTYCLSVIQQPERARACGSGAKSSADRRPVDPPPVVELRIFEGEDAKTDVTFSYNANFFLFATLEVCRPIAHGRVQPATPQIPVLTGMPVSGMAYLDRPTEAGYFIFPDLSVRHEGIYRLSFNLYEETKEAKDMDAEPANDKPKVTGPGGPDSSFDWRLEVKSVPFNVFSAKKFPGLAESTILSRTVAEQGCRVRIRRDVRMRRRDGKNSSEYDEMAEDEYTRSHRTPTPQQDAYRQRSLSAHGMESPSYEAQRRPSGDYAAQPYSSYNPSQPGPPSYLSFGGSSSSQYQAPAPPPPSAQPQFPPPSQPSYQQPQAGYSHPGSQYRQTQPPPPPPPPSGGFAVPERPPYSQYPASGAAHRDGYDSEYRRSSGAYGGPASQAPPYLAVDQNYNRNSTSSSYQSFPRPHSPAMPASVSLAPLKMPPMEPKYEHANSPSGPLPPASRLAPPLPSPSFERASDRPGSYSQYPAPASSSEPPRNGKRSYDSVFNSSSTNQPLYNGMRPSSSHHMLDDDDEISVDQLRMQYKRADGTSYSRELPVLE